MVILMVIKSVFLTSSGEKLVKNNIHSTYINYIKVSLPTTQEVSGDDAISNPFFTPGREGTWHCKLHW